MYGHEKIKCSLLLALVTFLLCHITVASQVTTINYSRYAQKHSAHTHTLNIRQAQLLGARHFRCIIEVTRERAITSTPTSQFVTSVYGTYTGIQLNLQTHTRQQKQQQHQLQKPLSCPSDTFIVPQNYVTPTRSTSKHKLCHYCTKKFANNSLPKYLNYPPKAIDETKNLISIRIQIDGMDEFAKQRGSSTIL